MQNDGIVCGERPRRSGPDGDVELALPRLKASGHGSHLEADEDSRTHLVAVLNLCFGKGRMAVAAPMYWLAPAIDGARVPDSLKDFYIGSVIVISIGKIRVIPLAKHTETLEALTLRIHLLDGHLATESADGGRGELAELVLAHHVLDLVLDGKAMAVPAGHVGNLATLHDPVSVDDVLGDLVLRMTQVNGAICVGRPVMQHELLVALVLFERKLVDTRLLPSGEPLRLILGKVGTHRELGARQVRRLFVALCHQVILPAGMARQRNVDGRHFSREIYRLQPKSNLSRKLRMRGYIRANNGTFSLIQTERKPRAQSKPKCITITFDFLTMGGKCA